jgi:hypothetical protein
MIAKITKVYTRTYSDTGQRTTYVEWADTRGKPGRTEGDATNTHMASLIARGQREGIAHTVERW